MAPNHPEFDEYAAAAPELEKANEPTPCPEDDHDWRYEWPEHDVGFGGLKECKVCGVTAALTRDDLSQDYEYDDGTPYYLENAR